MKIYLTTHWSFSTFILFDVLQFPKFYPTLYNKQHVKLPRTERYCNSFRRTSSKHHGYCSRNKFIQHNSYGRLGDEILSYQAHFKSKRQTSVLFLVLFDVVLFLVRFMCGLMTFKLHGRIANSEPKGRMPALWVTRAFMNI